MPALKTRTVPALDRALTLLELLSQSQRGLTLPDLVAQSNLPRSSVHYLLVTLERRGYLHRNERTSRYLFGQKVLALANGALAGLSLKQQAAPHLSSLAQRTHLTAHLAILERNDAVVVAKHEPPQASRLATWIGKRMNVHCTGLGKVLIAHMPLTALDRLLADHPLPRHNEYTLSSPRRLKEELARVVELGYAVDNEEDELGLRCIGAPVRGASADVIAAVSISGPAAHITPTNLEELARIVKGTAAAISATVVRPQ